jgi:hypothetical protein
MAALVADEIDPGGFSKQLERAMYATASVCISISYLRSENRIEGNIGPGVGIAGRRNDRRDVSPSPRPNSCADWAGQRQIRMPGHQNRNAQVS